MSDKDGEAIMTERRLTDIDLEMMQADIEEHVEAFVFDRQHRPWKRFDADALVESMAEIYPAAGRDLLAAIIEHEAITRGIILGPEEDSAA